MNKKRFIQVDYIKAMASFFVVAVHFRNRIETTISAEHYINKYTYFFSLNYALFIIAVPLFLISTGFLLVNYRASKKKYLDLLDTYLTYLFIALVMYTVMVLFQIREPLPIQEMIYKAMKFNLISGWYLELYFGLMLMIPFINDYLSKIDQKTQQKLILMLMMVVGLPALVNASPFTENWLYLPDFFTNLYPIVYYIIGNYIRKYQVDVSIKRNLLLLLMIFSFLLIYFNIYYGAVVYTSTSDGYYASILQMVLSSSFFLYILSFKDLPANKVVSFIAKQTLLTYIVTLPIDRLVYYYFNSKVAYPQYLIKYSPIVVIVSFTIALIVGALFSMVIAYFKMILSWLMSSKSTKKQ